MADSNERFPMTEATAEGADVRFVDSDGNEVAPHRTYNAGTPAIASRRLIVE